MRVMTDQVGATEGSTSPAARRFSPVYDAGQQIVPVIYAGATLGCALGETVFHDLADAPSTLGVIYRADLLALRAGHVTVTTAIRIADLTDLALGALGYDRAEVVGTPPADYAVTRRWAQHVWDGTDCHGIVWNSRRSPGAEAVLLFLDAPAATDRGRTLTRRRLTIWAPPLPLHDGDGFTAVLTSASDRNVTVVL